MRPVRVLCASAVLVLLAGCGLFSPPPEPPKLLTRAEADARSVVPFTRGVRLDKAGRIVDVTFDAPAAVDPQMSWLKLGLRLQGAEQKPVSEATENLRQGVLKARIVLQRLDDSGPKVIPLSRPSSGGRGMQVLPEGGYVERLSPGGVDSYPLEQAGLKSKDVFYLMLQIADAGLIDAGRYRVTLDLLEDRPDLKDVQPEFIAAYYSLGK